MNQIKGNRPWLTISPLAAVFLYIAGALCVMAYGWTRTPFGVRGAVGFVHFIPPLLAFALIHQAVKAAIHDGAPTDDA